MSFSSNVKNELCGSEVPAKYKDQLISGLYCGFRGSDPSYSTSDKGICGYILKNFPPDSLIMTRNVKARGESYSFVSKEKDTLLDYDIALNGNSTGVIGGNDKQVGYFLRGLFIVCGRVYVQKAGYHMEIILCDNDKCDIVHRIINEQGMSINMFHRKQNSVLYSKNSEHISDFLTFIGAMHSSMQIMNIKIMKDVRNNINRSVNCETANIDRTVRASAKQVEDIELIAAVIGLDELSDDLKEIARLRLDNPDMSLRELTMLTSGGISRSGINHRFERLAKIAANIKQKRDG